jgi:hypothetical protein
MAVEEKAAEVAVAMAYYRDHCSLMGASLARKKVKLSFVGTGER